MYGYINALLLSNVQMSSFPYRMFYRRRGSELVLFFLTPLQLTLNGEKSLIRVVLEGISAHSNEIDFFFLGAQIYCPFQIEVAVELI